MYFFRFSLVVMALGAAMVGCSDSSGGGGPDGGSGSGGGSGSAKAGECAEVCVQDDDCAELLVCTSGTCSCASDELCQISGIAGTSGCTSDDECTDTGTRCVKWGGTTMCVRDNTTDFGCGLGSTLTKVTVELADGSGTIGTCADTRLRCGDDGQCGIPPDCQDDSDCAVGHGTNTCDVASGRCVCVVEPEDSCTAQHPGMQCKADGTCGCLEDAICPSSTGGHCFVETGECGCLEDGDCGPAEICHEGQCRCVPGEVNTCGILFSENPGTSYQCVPL
jgi:hypothetical protein